MEEQRRRGVFGLRRAFWGLALTLTVLTAIAAGGLLFSAYFWTAMERELTRIAVSLEAADEIETGLLSFNLSYGLERARPGRGHGERASQVARDLENWIAIARERVQSEEEARVLDALEDGMRDNLALQREAQQAGLDPGEFYTRSGDSLDRALDSARRFTRINREEARQLHATSDTWRRMVIGLGIAISLLLPMLVVASLRFTRRFYRSFVDLADAIHGYTTGDLGSRAPSSELSELRSVALRFNEMADQLASNQQGRARFLAAVAHDLRTPLTALKTAVELQRRATSLEGSRSRIEVIQRQVDRLQRMVEDLLDSSRIEAGNLELRFVDMDLRAPVDDAVRLFEGTSARHRLITSVPDAPVLLAFDETRISQVLANLVSNAIKYSPDGGEVRIRLEEFKGVEVRLSVSDQGLGLSAEDRARLFEPFQRIRTAEAIPGVGLGLSVAKRLIEGHGGRLEIASEVGRGSTFTVVLPSPGGRLSR